MNFGIRVGAAERSDAPDVVATWGVADSAPATPIFKLAHNLRQGVGD
jgi:hypothetical protein